MRWFDQLNKVFLSSKKQVSAILPEMATAVLLFEVMKMDEIITSDEEAFLYRRLSRHFDMNHQEVTMLAKNAQLELENSVDYHQFTHAINQNMSIEEKIELVESMWSMALSDGEISAEERHLIRKIADLLHLRESEILKAKVLAVKKQ